MTDSIEQKALALIDKTRRNSDLPKARDENARGSVAFPALLCAIEQHEAFKLEVSDAVAAALDCGDVERLRREGILSRFIIAKPDPLVDYLTNDEGYFPRVAKEVADRLRSKFEIKEKR